MVIVKPIERNLPGSSCRGMLAPEQETERSLAEESVQRQARRDAYRDEVRDGTAREVCKERRSLATTTSMLGSANSGKAENLISFQLAGCDGVAIGKLPDCNITDCMDS
jgi:hypothetical protein